MSTVIGIISFALAGAILWQLLASSANGSPANTVANRESFVIIALFLIAAAICFK